MTVVATPLVLVILNAAEPDTEVLTVFRVLQGNEVPSSFLTDTPAGQANERLLPDPFTTRQKTVDASLLLMVTGLMLNEATDGVAASADIGKTSAAPKQAPRTMAGAYEKSVRMDVL